MADILKISLVVCNDQLRKGFLTYCLQYLPSPVTDSEPVILRRHTRNWKFSTI